MAHQTHSDHHLGYPESQSINSMEKGFFITEMLPYDYTSQRYTASKRLHKWKVLNHLLHRPDLAPCDLPFFWN